MKLKVLTDMLPLLHATQNPPSDLGTRSLIYDMGPWKGENLLTGIESFFQKNAYLPFATSGIFDFRSIAPGETIRKPVNTFREFSQFIDRKSVV